MNVSKEEKEESNFALTSFASVSLTKKEKKRCHNRQEKQARKKKREKEINGGVKERGKTGDCKEQEKFVLQIHA